MNSITFNVATPSFPLSPVDKVKVGQEVDTKNILFVTVETTMVYKSSDLYQLEVMSMKW